MTCSQAFSLSYSLLVQQQKHKLFRQGGQWVVVIDSIRN